MKNRLSKFISKFRRDLRGGVALMAGFSFPVVFIAIGGSIDYTRASSNTSKLQSAMDSAVLALTRKEPGTFKLQSEGEKLLASFLSQHEGDIKTSEVRFSSDGTSISGSAGAETKTFFLTFIGKPSMTGAVSASAIPPSRRPIEVALVLDVSGSMDTDLNGQTRIARMQAAVNEMFDTLDDELPVGTKLSASLVPYSSSVNLSNFRSGLKTGSVAGNVQPTTEDVWAAERLEAANGNSYILSDKPPSSGKIPFVTASEMTSPQPVARLEALSENIEDVRADVNGLTATGWTAGHLGMVWGFYTLSPSWKMFWPTAPARYGDADKFILLLSDGAFNTTYNIGDSPDAVIDPALLTTQNDNQLEADAYFQDVCKLTRDNDIKIFIVALSLDLTAETKLEACAGGPGSVYAADTATELSTAFKNIARQIGRRRLTN